jgi:hypothetical protein
LEVQVLQPPKEVLNARLGIFVKQVQPMLYVNMHPEVTQSMVITWIIADQDVDTLKHTLKHIFVQHEVRHVQRFVQVTMQQALGIHTTKKKQEIKRKGASHHIIVLVGEKRKTVINALVTKTLVINALAKKSLVLLVHLVPVRNFRTIRVMVYVHLGFIVPPVQIKTMKTDVVENRVTHLAQQHFIVYPEVKHLKKSMQTTILSVVLPKRKIVHPATL